MVMCHSTLFRYPDISRWYFTCSPKFQEFPIKTSMFFPIFSHWNLHVRPGGGHCSLRLPPRHRCHGHGGAVERAQIAVQEPKEGELPWWKFMKLQDVEKKTWKIEVGSWEKMGISEYHLQMVCCNGMKLQSAFSPFTANIHHNISIFLHYRI